MSRYTNIVFDVGSVLVNWMRMNLYTTLFHGDREKAKWIIDHVVTNEWNDQTDLGKPIDEPTLKSKACLKCLYFTKIISDLCRNLECFSYLYTINQTE